MRRRDGRQGDEATATFAYTPTGRREQAANGSGIVRYTYDLRDRMVKKQMPAGTLSYTYDPHGNVATMKSSNAGGVDIAYGWDGANRLVSVTDPAGASTFEYDAAGRMTKRTDPNGVVMTYAYDDANRVLDVSAKRGITPLAEYTYTRDTIGRVTTLVELTGRTVSYGYSMAGRLVSETITGEPHGVNGTIAYAHDPVGNRLTRTSTVAPIPAQTFAYDANDRITTETYDANGNTLSSDSDAFLYDFEDRLVAVNSGVTLTYDAAGNLGSRMEAGTKVAYLVDELSPAGYTQVVEDVTNGAVSKTYAYGRTPLRSGGQSYIADGHTDVRLLADASGVVTDEYDYEAFGAGTRTAGSSANPLRYTGERAEAAGLTFLRARHMKNATGRFFGTDPWAGRSSQPASLHRFQYGVGEPVQMRDHSGAFTLPELMVGVAIVGVAAVGAVTLTGCGTKSPTGLGSGNIPLCAQQFLWKEYFRFSSVDLGRIRVVDESKAPQDWSAYDGNYDESTGAATITVDFKQNAAEGVRKGYAATGWSNPFLLGSVAHEAVHVYQRMLEGSSWLGSDYDSKKKWDDWFAPEYTAGAKYNPYNSPHELSAYSISEPIEEHAAWFASHGQPVCGGVK